MKAKNARTIYGPVHKLHINSLYYITYRMLEQVLEMTSSSPTCFTPGEQIEKSLRYIGKWVCTSNTTIFIEVVYQERNINYKTYFVFWTVHF